MSELLHEVELASPAKKLAVIQQVVARTFGITVKELRRPARRVSVVWPQQVSMALSAEVLVDQVSPEEIARAHGRPNPTSVANAQHMVCAQADPALNSRLAAGLANLRQLIEAEMADL